MSASEPSAPPDPSEKLLRAIDQQLYDLRCEVKTIRTRRIGITSIAIGVCLGMLLYTFILFIAPILGWTSLAIWAANRDAESSTTPSTPAPTQSSQPPQSGFYWMKPKEGSGPATMPPTEQKP